MLTLGRHPGEKLFIGDDCVITLLYTFAIDRHHRVGNGGDRGAVVALAEPGRRRRLILEVDDRVELQVGGGKRAVLCLCDATTNKAKIGVEATPDVRVDREEYRRRIVGAGEVA